jgi:hypothetical protein
MSRNVGQRRTGRCASEHQSSTAHITPSDKLKRKQQASAKYVEKRFNIFRRSDATEENHRCIASCALEKQSGIPL